MNNHHYIWFRGPLHIKCHPHINAELEMVYVKQGQMLVNYGDMQERVSSGEIAVVLPYYLHGFETTTETETYVLMFSYLTAEEFLHRCQGDAEKNKFTPSPGLSLYLEQVLHGNRECPDVFFVKGMFNLLISEYVAGTAFSEAPARSGDTMRDLIRYMYDHLGDESMDLSKVSAAYGINKINIGKNFKSYLHMTFHDFINNIRIEKAVALLYETDMTISDIAYEVGFGSLRNFNRVFKKLMQCTPGAYRKQV